MANPVDGLLAYIDASPTPYHAVAETARQLQRAGFTELSEGEAWKLSAGDRRYVVRAGASIAAFIVGARPPHESGFQIVGAHTDSPNLRVKPKPDVKRHGYRQLGVEVYGGVLYNTWLDRDLSIAGRVVVAGESRLVDFGRPLLRIPNLCIHLNRKVNTDGLVINAQKHLVPVMGLDDGNGGDLRQMLAAELSRTGDTTSATQISAWDLCLYDTQPAARSGAQGEFIHAARLDNLASCHTGLAALTAADESAPSTRAIVLYDHEEVGSQSAQGAGSTFLATTLQRVSEAMAGGAPEAYPRAVAHSMLISADMAHAVHPNYADRHESGHQPVLGRGPVIKTNAGQAYATDAETSAGFQALCDRAGVVPQQFVNRSDLACGSTIGPISAGRVGLRTVDVGNPLLSMHSIREMAGSADVESMLKVLGAFFAS